MNPNHTTARTPGDTHHHQGKNRQKKEKKENHTTTTETIQEPYEEIKETGREKQ